MTPGKYTFSFDIYAPNNGKANHFDASFDGFSVDGASGLTQVSGTAQTLGTGWTQLSFNFKSGGGPFVGFEFFGGGSPAADVVVDNFSLTAAVPEPSTWAMMLIGMAGLGFMAYRRKAERFSTSRCLIASPIGIAERPPFGAAFLLGAAVVPKQTLSRGTRNEGCYGSRRSRGLENEVALPTERHSASRFEAKRRFLPSLNELTECRTTETIPGINLTKKKMNIKSTVVAAGYINPRVLERERVSLNITYNVDLVDGPNSIVGSITTDGTIGELSEGNFVDFN